MKNRYEIRGEVTVIFIKVRRKDFIEALIDTEDIDKVSSFNHQWNANPAYGGKIYVRGRETWGECVLLHRMVTDCPPELMVDHINGNTLDNRKCNLRKVTCAENQQNRHGPQTNSKSGVRNVYWHKRNNKWCVKLKIHQKSMYFGYYDDLEEAKSAAIEARKKYMTHAVI